MLNMLAALESVAWKWPDGKRPPGFPKSTLKIILDLKKRKGEKRKIVGSVGGTGRGSFTTGWVLGFPPIVFLALIRMVMMMRVTTKNHTQK